MKKYNISKRIMSLVLSLIMVVGLMPVAALASDVFPGKPDGMSVTGSSTETINGQTVWLCPNSGGSMVKKNTGNGYAIYEAAPYGGYTFSHWATYCVAADWWDTFESANRYDKEEGYAFSKSDSKAARYNEKDSQIRVNTSNEANYTYYVYAVFVQGVSVSISVEGGGANIHAKNLDNYNSSIGEYEHYVQNAEGTVHFGVGKNSKMQVQILSDWVTYYEHVYVNDVDVIDSSYVYYSEYGSDRRHFYIQTFTVTDPITIRVITKQRGVNVAFYSNAENAAGTMEKQFMLCYEDYNIPENRFVNEGYIFSGWNTKADGTGTSYTDKQSVRFAIADDGTELSLYAQWTKCNNHTWTNGECTKCGAICSHSGGTATCTEKAACTQCGLKYGSTLQHQFVYSDEDNMITESCERNCGHSATATLVQDTNISTVYTGSAIEALKVNYSDNWQGGQLDIVYSMNINAGTASGSISVDGATATKTFEITKADISGLQVSLFEDTFIYNGLSQKPVATVTFNGTTLTENADYELWYISSDQVSKWENGEPVKFFGNTQADCINAGQYYAIVNGKGNYFGTKSKAFTIEPKTVTATVLVNGSQFIYNESAFTPDVIVKDGDTVIPANEYEVSYSNNTNAGTATVIVTDKAGGNYVVNGSTTFIINKANPVIGTVGVDGVVKDNTKPSEVVLTRTDTTVDGVLKLADDAMLANKSTYRWVFTPTDTDNYNVINGDVQIDVLDTVLPTAGPGSPNTGDNSILWFWVALLFVSGAGLFGIILIDRKRKTKNK